MPRMEVDDYMNQQESIENYELTQESEEIEVCPYGYQEDEPCCDDMEERLGIEICEFQCPFNRLYNCDSFFEGHTK